MEWQAMAWPLCMMSPPPPREWLLTPPIEGKWGLQRASLHFHCSEDWSWNQPRSREVMGCYWPQGVDSLLHSTLRLTCDPGG